jgi:hypothetical protein
MSERDNLQPLWHYQRYLKINPSLIADMASNGT